MRGDSRRAAGAGARGEAGPQESHNHYSRFPLRLDNGRMRLSDPLRVQVWCDPRCIRILPRVPALADATTIGASRNRQTLFRDSSNLRLFRPTMRPSQSDCMEPKGSACLRSFWGDKTPRGRFCPPSTVPDDKLINVGHGGWRLIEGRVDGAPRPAVQVSGGEIQVRA
jgi:hypothetical protein